MLDLADLNVFIKVVETESLTRAGEALGLPKSTVSRRLSRLERALHAQLLHRTSRRVTVTQDGALFFEYCLRSLGVLRDGERALQNQQRTLQGVIRIAVPHVLGQSLLGPIFAGFLDLYPEVRLVSVLSDDAIGLLRAGFDVALATGPLPDSGLIAVKLGATDSKAIAAPAYFERKGAPQSHADLPRFDLLAAGTSDRRQRWTLRHARQEVGVEFVPRLLCNDLPLLREAAVAGLGIANLPTFLCHDDLTAGRLVEALPGWRAADLDFFALFADPRAVPARVRTLIDYLVEQLRPRLAWSTVELPAPEPSVSPSATGPRRSAIAA